MSRVGDPAAVGNNIRALVLIGSAMEHGVIEQSYPDRNAVSTVRYLRENNLAGGKTYRATTDNYSDREGLLAMLIWTSPKESVECDQLLG